MPLDLFAEEEKPLDLFADEMPAITTPETRRLALMVKPEREPILSPEFKREFIETTKALGRLAKQPMGIIEGVAQFATSLPGFGVGVIKGTQNIIESLQRPTNMSDLYDAFMEGLEEGAEALEPIVYKPHIPEAELVGATAMVPWTGAQMALNKIADDPIYDNYPNLRGYLKFSGFVGGAKLMKQMYHPNLSKGMVKNITDVSEQAMKMREAYELVKEMPESPLKVLRLRELEIRERGIRERLATIENKIQRPKTAEEIGIRKVEREVPEISKLIKPKEYREPYTKPFGRPPVGEVALGKGIKPKEEPVIYDKIKGRTIERPPFFEFEREKGLTAEDKLRAKLKGVGKKIQKLRVEKKPIDLFKEEKPKPTATFRGWQETVKGDHIALYNVEGGRLDKSTVTFKTLEKEGIKIPKTPEKPKLPPTVEKKVKEIPEVTKGVFDPKKPPTEPEGFMLSAIRMKDGKIYYDKTAKVHADILESLKIDPAEIKDTGIIKDGEYKIFGATLKPIIRQAEARRIIAAKRAKVKIAPKVESKEVTLETFGFQTAYEKAAKWTKEVKEGREVKVRETVDKMREDYLKPIEGNPLDKSAVNYLKSEKYPDYLKSMPSIGELRPNEIFRYDPTAKEMIAGYLTKEGKLKPAIRQSGYHAIKEFADAFTFDKKKHLIDIDKAISKAPKTIAKRTKEQPKRIHFDIKVDIEGGTDILNTKNALRIFREKIAKATMDIGKLTGAWTDPTRMLEQLDQGKWAGMAQKHILWPTRMTTQAKLRWADNQKANLSKIFEDYKITSGKKRKAAGDILEHIDNEKLNVSANNLLKIKEIREALKGYKDKTQITIIEGTKSLRRLLNRLLDEENQARELRGQKKIPYRKFYRTWIMEANLWAKLSGQRMRPKEIMESPEMPDFIKPNNAFISHAERRSGLLAKYAKERDIGTLLSDYIETAAKDIFDTNIVHNNKIHSTVLRGKGLENAANAIDTWTSEAYAGVNPRFTRWAKETIPPSIRGGALKIRRNLTRAVFPLNWTWNAFIQTSSSGITYARYGNKATLAGLEYFTSPTLRRAIKQNAYSSIIKSRWGGRTHYQDIQNSILKNKRLDAKPIEKAEDFANFLTSAMEDALTGHAVAAAYYDGKTRLNLKGRELWEYASEGGAKTQSMYNYQDLPGLLRAREVGAAAPFQTFAFEVFNTVREMNLPIVRRVIGKTGLYETMSADSVAGKALLSKRLMMVGRWTAAMVVTNAVVEKAIGRKPWVLSSFVPFIGYILGGTMITGYPGRGPDFTPKKYIDDFRKGVKDVLVSEDFGKLRKWTLRYHVLAGIQMERTISGIEAISKGGRVKDVRGRLLYRIKPEDYLKAITMGPSRTEAARKYYEKREEGLSTLEKLRKKFRSSEIKAITG